MRHLLLVLLAVSVLTSCAVKRELDMVLFNEHVVGTDTPGVHPALIPATPEDRIGVNFHGHEITSYDFITFEDSVFQMIRSDTAWETFVEREPGVYNWRHLDLIYEAVNKRNGRLLIILNYGNPRLYGREYANPESWSDEHMTAWLAMVDAASQRFDSDRVIFEIWNEPDNDDFWDGIGAEPEAYVEFARVTAEAIRRNNPDACIAAAASAGVELAWNQRAMEVGLLEFIDVLTVHPYRDWDRRPETVVDDLRDLQRSLYRNNNTGRTIPIAFSEWGYGLSNTDGPFDDPEEIAQLFWEMSEIVEQEKLPFFVWYQWRGVDEASFLNDQLERTPLYHEIHR